LRIVDAGGGDWLPSAVETIRRGGVVAVPTETVYGLAAGLLNPAGQDKIFLIKGRKREKALPVQADSLQRARTWGFAFSPRVLRIAAAFWPGPLTLILPRPPACPAWFAPDSPTLALRIPDHPVTLALLAAVGAPLAVTSANPSGLAECLTAGGAAETFGSIPDLLVLDGGPVPGGKASTVVDVTGREPVLLRRGPIQFKDLLGVWNVRG